jgi:hypothetical protein
LTAYPLGSPADDCPNPLVIQPKTREPSLGISTPCGLTWAS